MGGGWWWREGVRGGGEGGSVAFKAADKGGQ